MSPDIGVKRNLPIRLRTNLGLHRLLLFPSKQCPEQINMIINEMQQLPNVEKVDPKKRKSCPNWAINNGRGKFVCNSKPTLIQSKLLCIDTKTNII